MKKTKNSFVLIELILVILLVSVIAGLSSPRFRNSFTSLKLKDTCFNIVKLANYAQEMAIVERVNYKMTFNSQSGQFYLSRAKDSQKVFSLPKGFSFSTSANPLEVFFYPDGRLKAQELKVTANNGEARLINFKSFGSKFEIKSVN